MKGKYLLIITDPPPPPPPAWPYILLGLALGLVAWLMAEVAEKWGYL
jgi:H+/Cl- antiporter ClcA